MTRLFAGTQFDIPPRCDRCGELEQDCQCASLRDEPQRKPPEKQSAKIRLDRRKHKRLITVVTGLSEPDTDLPDLLSKLKSACGAGGTIQDGQMEIQGDHVDRVRATLGEIGYRVQ
ncbi:MAG: translation initiation factor [Pirellulaceae bacterium]|nr:translation initiation factor [Pirellulaceae bacterium]